MRKTAKQTVNILQICIDFFYPVFSRFMNIQFYRYACVGAINLIFDISLFYLIHEFVFFGNIINLGFVQISAHSATLAIKFPIILLSGFALQKFITFTDSQIPSKKQLMRYLFVVCFNLLFCYCGLKLCVEVFHWNATLSNLIVTLITIAISYLFQKFYTFKIEETPVHENLA